MRQSLRCSRDTFCFSKILKNANVQYSWQIFLFSPHILFYIFKFALEEFHSNGCAERQISKYSDIIIKYLLGALSKKKAEQMLFDVIKTNYNLKI